MTPFDPADPFDALADQIANDVADMAAGLLAAAEAQGMTTAQALECFIAGALTGTLGAAFCMVTPEGRDDIQRFVTEFLPHARQMAEEKMRNGLQ